MRFLFLAFFVLGDLMWWRWAHLRMWTRTMKIVVAVIAVTQLATLAIVIGSRAMGVAWIQNLPRPLLSAIYLWHLIVLLPWMLVAGPFALARAVSRGARKLSGLPPAKPVGMIRREFLRTALTLSPAAFVLGGAVVAEWQLKQFRVRRIEVPVAALPPALDGFTIAHVTDTHVGRYTHDAVLGRIVDATNSLGADLILSTGDLIDFSLRDLPAGIELLRALRARHGLFVCEGNHDLFEDAALFRRRVRDAGLPLLSSEGATLDVRGVRTQVMGLPWSHGDAGIASDMSALDKLRDPEAFPILLAHHPHAFDFSPNFPLVLAGHTHGGQLMLTQNVGAGPWIFRYWSGLYRKAGRSLLVSNGAGNWFPLRVNAPAEILHLTLRREVATSA